MDYEKIAKRLHEIERKVLLALKKKEIQELEELAKNSKVNKDAVQRALLWLESKKLVDVKDEIFQILELTEKGKEVLEKGLPEIRLLKLVKEKGMKISELKEHLTKDELNVSLGLLKRKEYISISQGEVKITEEGKKSLEREWNEWKLLKKEGTELKKLGEEAKAIDDLKERGLIKVSLKKNKIAKLTDEGKKIMKYVKLEKLIDQLTPEIIQSGEWRGKEFRSYDLKAPVPRTFPGKKHFLYQVMEMIKRIFIEMGFVEMRSNYVETCFWNYDVMFFPQDHPDRSIMDTFYLKYPLKGKVPIDYAKIIKKVQETGWITGSKGRRTKWDIEESKRLILRCHTTQTSFRYLAKKLKPPYKFFSVDRVFRNESVDYKHLPEFHQVEGFVVDEGLTFRNLLGNLKEFYNKMGVKKIKFKPVYNPYTEPSSEIFGWFPKLGKWIELGNSGVFRPEVLLPVGIKSPVIAWGLALERLAMFIYDIDDIRQCLGHTVDFNEIRTKELLTKIKK